MNRKPPKEYYKQQTERLLFRALVNDDIATWASFFNNNPSDRFIGAPQLGPNSIEKSKTWINKQIERMEQHTYGQLAVIEKVSGQFIGVGGIIERDAENGFDYEVTYAFLPPYWGKGYATELAIHFKQYIFDQIKAKSAISVIHVENEASMNVARKNGMQIDGEDHFLGMDVFVFRTHK